MLILQIYNKATVDLISRDMVAAADPLTTN